MTARLGLICLALPLALVGCIPAGGGDGDGAGGGSAGGDADFVDGGGGGAGGDPALDGGPQPDGGPNPDGSPNPDRGPQPDGGPRPDGDPPATDMDPPTPDRGPFPGTPCVNVVPAALDFGAAPLDRPTLRRVTIESCGGAILVVDTIELVDDGDGRFALDEATLPPLPLTFPATQPDAPPPSRGITFEFTPVDERPAEGLLRLETNDPLYPIVEIPLTGRGVDNACPVPAVEPGHYDVLPLDVVALNGAPSTDPDGPDGRPVRYEWTVVERPVGSVAQPVERFFDGASPADGGPADIPATPTARFFVDLAGDYVIELRVTDHLDLTAPSPACPEPTAAVRITAQPRGGLHVQLTWDTPADPDPADAEGTDVDLSLLHPTAESWAAGDTRCDYQNPVPDWGELGDPTDNPSLDIDDTNGAGPEVLSLGVPEDTARFGRGYPIGVHYYRAERRVPDQPSWGPSLALVRVFVQGVLAFEAEHLLPATGNFWEPAIIEWGPDPADRRVQLVDRFSDAPPP